MESISLWEPGKEAVVVSGQKVDTWRAAYASMTVTCTCAIHSDEEIKSKHTHTYIIEYQWVHAHSS